MNAIELIEALKGADGETGLELIERLQCGQIDCSVLPSGKDNAVQQAQIWAQEARTQKGIVEEIGKLVGCANDWETVSAVKAALSGAQQGAAPQPAQVPEGWRLVPVEPTTEMLGEGAIALFAQSREPLSSAYRSMLEAAQRCPMLTAAPSGDAKREADELRKDAERYQWLRNRIFAADFDYGGLDAPCLIIAFPKGSIFTSDANETIDAARLRQSDSGDDSEEVV